MLQHWVQISSAIFSKLHLWRNSSSWVCCLLSCYLLLITSALTIGNIEVIIFHYVNTKNKKYILVSHANRNLENFDHIGTLTLVVQLESTFSLHTIKSERFLFLSLTGWTVNFILTCSYLWIINIGCSAVGYVWIDYFFKHTYKLI